MEVRSGLLARQRWRLGLVARQRWRDGGYWITGQTEMEVRFGLLARQRWRLGLDYWPDRDGG